MSLRRWILLAVGLIAVGAVGVAVYILSAAIDLPSYEKLKEYQPPVTSRVHAGDGELIAEFAREQRVFVPYEVIPPRVVQAFVAAEDQNFFKHQGIDPRGVARIAVVNIRNAVTGRRMEGASTITMQVAGNMLTGRDRSVRRKIREALTAVRIEQSLSKEQILELYLNEIFLGQRAYGVAAAALNYFGKPLDELTLGEAAYLAVLPKAPNNYHPVRNRERALARRAYVLDRMQEDGYITGEEAAKAKDEPLETVDRLTGSKYVAAEHFVEEVRRELSSRYGEKELLEGGFSIRSTLDTRLQEAARVALRRALDDYTRRRGFRGPIASVDLAAWQEALAKVPTAPDIGAWRAAVVLSVNGADIAIGFSDGKKAKLASTEAAWARTGPGARLGGLKPGNVIYVAAAANKTFAVRQIPEANGALVAMDPHTGRVLAMVGGYSFQQQQFNRATQAKRQPGSSFKSIVYAAALDRGYTPASLILDAPFVAPAGPGQDFYKPLNYSKEFYGLSTLRLGLEKSRNVMTVRLAQEMGMEPIVEYGKKFGVYDDLSPVLAMSLGAGETTLMRMTAAYAVFVNGGKKVTPTLIDRVQDRAGKNVFKRDQRECPACAASWSGQVAPSLADDRPTVIDPVTAYQITSMLEGAVQRGTGQSILAVGKPLAGKTGTTNDYKDAWFVGFSPDLVAGVWVGYDEPKSLGEGESGGRISAPIFRDFMAKALEGQPPTPFRIPSGVSLVKIDWRTGGLPTAQTQLAIIEAFRPGTEPTRTVEGERFSFAGGEGAPGAPTTEPNPQNQDLDGLY